MLDEKLKKLYRDNGNGLEIRGRGEWHQVDVLGQFAFLPPFIYPIRLISEAKCYRKSGRVGLQTVRGFVGMLKDISENYFVDVDNPDNIDYNLRFTDCGAIFSASGFTQEAQNYAFAHGVKLLSYENVPIIREIAECIYAFVDSLAYSKNDLDKREEAELRKKISRVLNNEGVFNEGEPLYAIDSIYKIRDLISRIRFSAVGWAAGGFPVHLISEDQFPSEIIYRSDAVRCEIYRLQNNPFMLKLSDSDWKAYFSVPEIMMGKFLKASDLISFKGKSLSYIDVPYRIGEIRRIIKFETNREWLEEIKKRAEVRSKGRGQEGYFFD